MGTWTDTITAARHEGWITKGNREGGLSEGEDYRIFLTVRFEFDTTYNEVVLIVLVVVVVVVFSPYERTLH